MERAIITFHADSQKAKTQLPIVPTSQSAEAATPVIPEPSSSGPFFSVSPDVTLFPAVPPDAPLIFPAVPTEEPLIFPTMPTYASSGNTSTDESLSNGLNV